MLQHQQTIQHLSHLLGYIQSKEYKQEMPHQVSGIVKKFKHPLPPNIKSSENTFNYLLKQFHHSQQQQQNYEIRNFQLQSHKLQWVGISVGNHLTKHIQSALRQIATQNKVKQIRFWGKIHGTQRDYYIIQGIKQPGKSHQQISLGAQKSGEGVNFYSFWVCNNPLTDKWTLLPDVTPDHIKAARKIKKLFKGNLDAAVCSYPKFEGTQKFYLKAQLSRMTHSLQLCPGSIYKVHDQNPKVIEADEQAKFPQFSELQTLEGWKHKNQMVLNLGRCSHFIDPSLGEEEVAALQDKLMAEDAEMERLKGIAQDKVPENLATSLGTQNVWLQKLEGDSQIFTKDEGSLVYGIMVLKNIYWPGWTTIGYKNGYCNFYIGNGLKSTQASWNEYANPDLQAEANDTKQQDEPNPKELPKPVQQQAKQQEEQND